MNKTILGMLEIDVVLPIVDFSGALRIIVSIFNSKNNTHVDMKITVPNKPRKEVKELIKNLKKINKDVDNNIFKSLCNVNLDLVLEYKKDKEKFNFLDKY